MLTKEEDHRYILIIGGISIFLPSILVEASAHVEVQIEEKHPTETIKEDNEKTLTYSKEIKEE
jgi:hypothetical protein